MMIRWRLAVPMALIAVLVIGAILYLGGGSKVYARHAAPDGQGIVELVTIARWQALQARDFEMPVAARYIEPDGTVIGPTAPFELVGNARLRWDQDGVSIGTVATFDRHGKRWSTEN